MQAVCASIGAYYQGATLEVALYTAAVDEAARSSFTAVYHFFSQLGTRVIEEFRFLHIDFFPEDTIVFRIIIVVGNLFVFIASLWASFFATRAVINHLSERAGPFGIISLQALSSLDSINKPDADKKTPLQRASAASNLYAVDSLIKRCGVDVDAKEKAFLDAVRRKDRRMIDFFIKNHPSVLGCQDSDGKTALHIAISDYDLQTAQRLLTHRSFREIIHVQDKRGYTALHEAVLLVQKDLLQRTIAMQVIAHLLEKVLLEFQKLEPTDRLIIEELFLQEERQRGDFAQMHALLKELREVADRLSTIDRDTVYRAFSKEARSYRAEWIRQTKQFFEAEHHKMTAKLMQVTCDETACLVVSSFALDLQKQRRDLALKIASSPYSKELKHLRKKIEEFSSQQRELVELLVTKEAKGDSLTKQHQTPLLLAIKEANAPLALYLAAKFLDTLRRSDHTGCHPLQYCLDLGDYPRNGFSQADFETFFALVNVAKEIDPSILDTRDRHGYTALYKMVNEGYFEGVQWLVGAGASLTMEFPWGDSLLHPAVYTTAFIVQYLVRRGTTLSKMNESGRTPLFQAALQSSREGASAQARSITNFLRRYQLD